MKSGSNLEKVLSEGNFAVTGELGPPRGADANVIKEKGRSQGMKTLREAGWDKVKSGISTVSEVLRVTQVE